MKATTIGLLTIALSVTTPSLLKATCTGYQYAANSGGSIGILCSTACPLSNELAAGIAMWNGCGQAGTGFPTIVNGTEGTAFNLTVVLGEQPTGQEPTIVLGCAYTDLTLNSVSPFEVQGGIIHVYNKRKDGSSCLGLTATIAHEIGHALSLGESTCNDNHIMAPRIIGQPDTRAVQSDECAAVDARWTTPQEAPGPPSDGPPKNLNCTPDPCSPIVINFDDRAEYVLTGAEAPVLFDIAATGSRRAMGWTAGGADEAFLWLDRNHNGLPDNGFELFGTVTPLKDGQPAGNGFVALTEFDDNHDGMIDSRDSIWYQLQLWRDLNHDGMAQPGEMSALAESRVTAIDLDYHWTGRHDEFGNLFGFKSKVWMRDPSGRAKSRALYDIFFILLN